MSCTKVKSGSSLDALMYGSLICSLFAERLTPEGGKWVGASSRLEEPTAVLLETDRLS